MLVWHHLNANYLPCGWFCTSALGLVLFQTCVHAYKLQKMHQWCNNRWTMLDPLSTAALGGVAMELDQERSALSMLKASSWCRSPPPSSSRPKPRLVAVLLLWPSSSLLALLLRVVDSNTGLEAMLLVIIIIIKAWRTKILSVIIIIMSIYHALINAPSAHMIHINLQMIFYTDCSKHAHTHTWMHTHTHAHTCILTIQNLIYTWFKQPTETWGGGRQECGMETWQVYWLRKRNVYRFDFKESR